MSDCPHCGQPIFDDVESVVRRFSPLEQLIYRRVAKAGHHGVEASRLYDYLYGNRTDGGPENQTLIVLISRLNRKLIPLFGRRIRAGRGARPAIYRLEDMPA